MGTKTMRAATLAAAGAAQVVPAMTVSGTAGNDQLFGDAVAPAASTLARTAAVGDANGSLAGADGEEIIDFNQTLLGLGGNDTIAGDVIGRGQLTEIELRAAAGNARDTEDAAGETVSADGGDDNRVHAFSDQIGGSDGADLLVGDVSSPGRAFLRVEAGTGASNLAAGGDRNQVIAFNDTLAGAAGDDIIVGDGRGRSFVVEAASGSNSYSPYGPEGAGGARNSIDAFNDVLHGGAGDDVVIGDFFAPNVTLRIYSGIARGGYSGSGRQPGSDNIATAHSDLLTGGAGNDTLIGDIFSDRDTNSEVRIEGKVGTGSFLDGADGGDYNAVTMLTDTLRGGLGDDLLVGDLALFDGSTRLRVSLLSGNAGSRSIYSGSGRGGNNCSISAGNDRLFGHGGDDLAVGDIVRDGIRGGGAPGRYTDVSISLMAGSAGYSDARGGNDNLIAAFDDTISGGSGADVLVGDVRSIDSEGATTFRVAAGSGRGGERNQADVLGDSLSGGIGNDTLCGDFWIEGTATASDQLGFLVTVGVGGLDSGGNSNRATALSDTLTAGGGEDLLIGDLFVQDMRSPIEIGAAAGSGAPPQEVNRGYSVIDGGNGGHGNSADLSNDTFYGRGGGAIVVGDLCLVDCRAPVTLWLEAGKGADGDRADGGAGGSVNRIVAFSDEAIGGAGADVFVGDLDRSGGTAPVNLRLEVGGSGDGSTSYYGGVDNGGAGGVANRIYAFSDTAESGGGADVFVGDIRTDGTTDMIDIAISVGVSGTKFDGTSADNGGQFNSAYAFNDSFTASGSGNCVIVGDIWSVGAPPPISITLAGTATNIIKAFADTLTGADGDDRIFGDFYDGTGGFSPTLSTSGTFDGIDRLFADSIVGGAGDDALAGGLGADTLSGGAGRDRFVFAAVDLALLGGLAPVDQITDFDLTDVLDLSALVGSVPTADLDDVLSLRIDGDDSVIAFDRDGSGSAASFTDVVRLGDFTTTLSLQTLIGEGTILIA